VAPVVEEIFFRGILYPTMRMRWGIIPAVIVSSLIFSAMHFHLPTFLPLFVLAVILSLTFEYTGSLAACIIAHSLFNSLSIIAIWLLRSVR
jgi:membrane protease YdiL (CAAX protease family)